MLMIGNDLTTKSPCSFLEREIINKEDKYNNFGEKNEANRRLFYVKEEQFIDCCG